jgi:ribokinase
MAERTDPAERCDVVVVGGANFDHVVRGARIPTLGETLVGDTSTEGPGGKGANAAISAARLGARSAFVGRVGVDAAGGAILERMRAERVDVSRVVADMKHPTGVALIMVNRAGRKAIMTAPGANARLRPADIEAARELFASAAVVVLQLEPELATVQAALRLARQSDARVILDAAPARTDLPPDLIAVDVFRANGGEASAITGIDVEDVESAREASRWLRERGAAATCIAFDDGDLLSWADGDLVLGHIQVTSVDTTGSGDAFVAGLAVGLAERRVLVDAAWLGAAAAALESTQLGAQSGIPTRAAVDQLLARTRH